MKRLLLPTAFLISLLTVSGAHAACGSEQVSIRNFTPEIDDWSDGSGKVVRLAGPIDTTCSSPSDVLLAVASRNARGSTIRQQQIWLNGVPPGGQDFDLAGNIAYDPAVGSYEISVARTR